MSILDVLQTFALGVTVGFLILYFAQALVYWCTKAFIKGREDGYRK